MRRKPRAQQCSVFSWLSQTFFTEVSVCDYRALELQRMRVSPNCLLHCSWNIFSYFKTVTSQLIVGSKMSGDVFLQRSTVPHHSTPWWWCQQSQLAGQVNCLLSVCLFVTQFVIVETLYSHSSEQLPAIRGVGRKYWGILSRVFRISTHLVKQNGP